MADRTRDIDLKEHMVSSYIFQIFETILYLLLRFCPGWDIIQRQKIDPFTTSSMHAHFARHSAWNNSPERGMGCFAATGTKWLFRWNWFYWSRSLCQLSRFGFLLFRIVISGIPFVFVLQFVADSYILILWPWENNNLLFKYYLRFWRLAEVESAEPTYRNSQHCLLICWAYFTPGHLESNAR